MFPYVQKRVSETGHAVRRQFQNKRRGFAGKNGFFKNQAAANVRDIADLAFELNRISEQEYELLQESNRLRDIVIHVDNFPNDLRDPRAFLDVQH